MQFNRESLTVAIVGIAALGMSTAHAGERIEAAESQSAEAVDAERAYAEPVEEEGVASGGTVERGGAASIAEATVAEQCVEADPPPAQVPPGAIGAGCFQDRFFVDLPVEAGPMSALFADELLIRLDGKKAQVLDWVCPDNDLVCRDLSNPLPLVIHQVLDANRAWSVIFDVPVRDDKLCDAVAGIRSSAFEARKTVHPNGPLPLVGRECALRIMGGAQAQPSADMLEWHLRKLGIQPGAGEPGPPVPVVVVDTGIRPEVGGPLGVTGMADSLLVGGYDPGVQIHPHGTHMALLVSQASPNAHIHDLRVLDENGHGAIADLAAGLEQIASSDLFEAGPLVVNLSLGWAPELSRPRTLEGPGCFVVEDPVGESVRYALTLLAQRGDSLSTVVVAAAGNRPHRADLVDAYYADVFNVDRDAGGLLPPRSNCATAPDAPTPDWFYPAEWNRRPTCDAQGNARFLTWAVGATDSHERPGALTVDNAETPVLAPGEHVYVDFPYSDAPPPDVCSADGYPNRLILPAAVTGSSASAALTSGVVAETQSRLMRNYVAPLSGPGAQRLIWLTADNVDGIAGHSRDAWRPDPLGPDPVEPSRISWCRAFHAVEQGTMGGDLDCAALLACADPAQRPAAVIDGDVEASCRVLADTCLASAVCNPPQVDPVHWDPAYQAPVTCLDPEACPTAWSDALPCEATAIGCGYERTIEQHSAAPVGPQPGTGTCPDCAFDLTAQTLHGEINTGFLSGTTFHYPHIIVDYFPSGSSVPKREYVAVPSGGPWYPGDYVKVYGLPPLPAGSGHKLSLWTYVDPPGPGNNTSDVSPLRLE